MNGLPSASESDGTRYGAKHAKGATITPSGRRYAASVAVRTMRNDGFV